MFGMLVLPVLVTAVVTNVVTVKDGRLSTGRWVGTYTSQLQENVLSAMFPAVQPVEYTNRSLIDDTLLRYLYLEGSYHADTPLRLPSLCVLSLNGTLGTAKNLTFHNISRFTGLVQLNDTHFSAVLGGTYDASSVPESAYDYPYSRGYMAIAIQGGSGNAVRGVRALANNSDGAIGITGSPNTEIAESNIGGPGRMTRGRCIWCLSTSRAIIHDNHVHHCSAHALDFDAYTSRSTAYSNLCEDNGEEGIFVEETASDNFIFNNTLRRNLCGIGVYANAVGPVARNMFVNNVLDSNRGSAITAGGKGHDGDKKTSLENVFVGNVALNNVGHNGGQYDVHHGMTEGDFWIGNDARGTSPKWAQMPIGGESGGSKNITAFIP